MLSSVYNAQRHYQNASFTYDFVILVQTLNKTRRKCHCIRFLRLLLRVMFSKNVSFETSVGGATLRNRKCQMWMVVIMKPWLRYLYIKWKPINGHVQYYQTLLIVVFAVLEVMEKIITIIQTSL